MKTIQIYECQICKKHFYIGDGSESAFLDPREKYKPGICEECAVLPPLTGADHVFELDKELEVRTFFNSILGIELDYYPAKRVEAVIRAFRSRYEEQRIREIGRLTARAMSWRRLGTDKLACSDELLKILLKMSGKK